MAFGDISNRAENTGSGTSINATFGSTPTSGNLLFAAVMTGAADVTSVISGGNSWTLAKKWVTGASENDACALYYRTAGASESTTVTFSPSASDEVAIQIWEAEGPFDGTVNGTPSDPGKGTVSDYDAGDVTTTVDNALLVAVVFTRNAANGGTLSNSWSDSFIGSTELTNTQTTNKSLSSATRLVSATGTYTTTVTLTSSGLAMGGIVAFGEPGEVDPDVEDSLSGSAVTGSAGTQVPSISIGL